MLNTSSMLPLDVKGYSSILADYNRDMMMKIQKKQDEIISVRNNIAEKELTNLRNKSNVTQEQILAAMKLNKLQKDSTVLSQYDHATSEIEVIHQEMQKYMIKTSFSMLERET